MTTLNISAKALITDIEGTTTNIEFVHKVLFPYARQALPDFVRRNAQNTEVKEQLVASSELAGLAGDDIEGLIAALLDWIAQDRKATPLKTLQGMIWKVGYEAGDFRGHLYPDAHAQLQRWHAAGLAQYVYSSGSVPAQQLLYGYSDYGDLRPLFSGWFDTRVGGKREASSYQTIATNIGESLHCAPKQIVFLSDVAAELDAAEEAGLQVVHIRREGNNERSTHPQANNFDHINIEILP